MDREIILETPEQARAFFANDRFAASAGMRIEEVSPRHAVISLRLNETHRNAAGGVMGGVLFTMADFACAVAAHFGAETGAYVSADANIRFLNACSGDHLTAEADCVKNGGRLSFYEAAVRDDAGVLLAKASFTMCRVGEPTKNIK